jgi:hypothetical protein
MDALAEKFNKLMKTAVDMAEEGVLSPEEFKPVAEKMAEHFHKEALSSMKASDFVEAGVAKLVGQMKQAVQDNVHRGACVYGYTRPRGTKNTVLELALSKLKEDGFDSEVETFLLDKKPATKSKLMNEKVNVTLMWGV